MKLCVIPARGGSKRIPRKNIKDFGGRPMIAWSIAAARESALFDHVIVSTDDAEIAAISREAGAETPFMRPAALADDHTGTTDVVAHAVDWYRAQGAEVGVTACLYATAPFVRAEDLRTANTLLDASGAKYVFAATNFDFPIQRAIRPDEAGGVLPMFPESIGMRSQDLPEAFHDAGQFYLGAAEHWLARLPVFGTYARMHLLPRHRVQDIDTPEDWRRAEWLFRAMREAGE
jgi:N-acylneuraminate cytidylyltransferase